MLLRSNMYTCNMRVRTFADVAEPRHLVSYRKRDSNCNSESVNRGSFAKTQQRVPSKGCSVRSLEGPLLYLSVLVGTR